MKQITTFIIPSIGRPTLDRAIKSIGDAPYLTTIDEERRGPAICRNEMIKEATTPWVSFLDDDDTVTEDYVERLREEVANHPDADLIYFKEYFLWGQIIPKYPHCGWGNIGISFSVRRDVAIEMPFKSERYEDFEFVHRLERAGKKIVFSNYLTYRGRH